MSDLSDQVILLTGANGGLGSVTAVELANRGATVVLLARKVRQLERVYDAVIKSRTNPEPVIYPLDLEGASPDDYFEMADAIREQLGRLDAVVHMAANFEGLTPLNQLDPAKLARALHVNFTAMAWLNQAVAPLLRDTAERTGKPSRIAVVVDDAERVSGPFWGGYGLAHKARADYVRMHARELGTDQTAVAVIGIMPGPMKTMLRSRAYADDVDPRVRMPVSVAPRVVNIIAVDDAMSLHGQVVNA